MSAPVLRDFRPQDLDGVLALRARVFPELAGSLARERRRWRWEFDENPTQAPGAPRAWVFEQDGRIVGNYGLVPTPIAIDGRVRVTFNGIDFAIAPELQGQGLGHQIAARHMDAQLCDFPFLSGPTPAVAHLMRKHGATIVNCARERSLWRFVCASPAPTPRSPREVSLQPIEGFGPRFDELFQRVKERHRILVARDHRYLNWRYRDYPFGRPRIVSAVGRDGLLRGFFVLQRDAARNVGYLLELFADPREEWVLRGLVAGAIAQGRALELAEVAVLTRVPEAQAVLRAAGFEPVAEHALEYAFRLPAAPKDASAARGAPTADDWNVSGGDGDLMYGLGEFHGDAPA